MSRRRFGLRQRFIALLFSLFVVMFTGVVVILVARTASSQRLTLNEQTKSFATLSTKPIGDTFILYKDSGEVRVAQQIAKFADLNPDITSISITDDTGNVLFTNSDETPSVTAAQAGTFEPIYQYQGGVIQQVITPVIEDYGAHRYNIVFAVSDQRITDSIERTVAIILLLSGITFTLAIGLTYWLINKLFLSPVRSIRDKALSISAGDFNNQIQLRRNDEVGDLAAAINTMATSLHEDITKLEEADELKSEFISISSHNLRTPLAVIRGNIELLQSMDIPDNQKAVISDLQASAARLNNFIEDLLAISNMESGKLASYKMEPTGIRGLLQTIAADCEQLARQHNLQFSQTFYLGDEQVVMSQHLLRHALINLVDNAFKFTKEGSVRLEAGIQGDTVVIKVIDTGIGISAQEQDKLFTKFHRGTDIMEYDYEGTGIGLYLTKLIIDDHKGTISVESTEGQGSTFTISLPLAAPQPGS